MRQRPRVPETHSYCARQKLEAGKGYASNVRATALRGAYCDGVLKPLEDRRAIPSSPARAMTFR